MAKGKTNVSRTGAAAQASSNQAKTVNVEELSELVLKKLQALNLDQGLQADLQWCLGSYRYDKNPIGLYEMMERALKVLKAQREKNARTVSLKLLKDITRALERKA